MQRRRKLAIIARSRPARIAGLTLAVIVGVAAVTAYGVALWRAPGWMHATTAQDRYNARVLVISAGGAIVVGAGLLYTARNYRLSRRGQVTDRFTTALERLGSSELYVRIGGVHALEHVMRDSADHHDDVIEVLSKFIRDRAPRRGRQPDHQGWMHPVTGSIPDLPSEPTPDIQAALTALGHRPHRPERQTIDLDGVYLASARLRGANLTRARLRGADLTGATLDGADLAGAVLDGADLTGATLWDVNLSGAEFNGATLTGAHVARANLTRTHFVGADLTGAHLHGAGAYVWLGDADLTGASLAGARLTRAQLGHANLTRADLGVTKFTDAVLANANLTGASLAGTDLTGANLNAADLTGAKLIGVDLTGADWPVGEAVPEGWERVDNGRLKRTDPGLGGN